MTHRTVWRRAARPGGPRTARSRHLDLTRRPHRIPWQPRPRLSPAPSARPPTSSMLSTLCPSASSSLPAWSNAPSWRRRSPVPSLLERTLQAPGCTRHSRGAPQPLSRPWQPLRCLQPWRCLQRVLAWRARGPLHPPSAPALCTRPGSSTLLSQSSSRCSSPPSSTASGSAATAPVAQRPRRGPPTVASARSSSTSFRGCCLSRPHGFTHVLFVFDIIAIPLVRFTGLYQVPKSKLFRVTPVGLFRCRSRCACGSKVHFVTLLRYFISL